MSEGCSLPQRGDTKVKGSHEIQALENSILKERKRSPQVILCIPGFPGTYDPPALASGMLEL
jgi:hypothetical protein